MRKHFFSVCVKRNLYTGICLLVLFAICAVSVGAWIYMRSTVDNTGININIEPTSTITTIRCHALKYDGITGADCTLIDSEGIVLEMSEYDKIFLDRNVNTPLIFCVELEGVPATSSSAITVKIPCYQTLSDNVSDPMSYSSVGADTILNYLSNVIVVRLGGASLNAGGTAPAHMPTASNTSGITQAQIDENVALYQEARDSLKTSADTGKFITVQHSTVNDQAVSTAQKIESYVIEVDIDYDDYSAFLYDIDATDHTGTMMFFIELDYDDELIALFLEKWNDSMGNAIFNSDIGTITIS